MCNDFVQVGFESVVTIEEIVGFVLFVVLLDKTGKEELVLVFR